MPQASLSALVAALQSSWSRHEFELLLATFRDAELGVVDLNQPKGAHHAAPAGEIQLGMVQGEGEPPRIVAFDQPERWMAKLGHGCNLSMRGAEIFQRLLSQPDCAGIVLYSSEDEPLSITLERADIELFLRS